MTTIQQLRLALAAIGLVTLAACGGSDAPPPVPPSITTQPADASAAEGGVANFSVVAAGTDTLSYAWLNAADSSPIAGATAATWQVNPLSLTDSGKAFKVRVSNTAGDVTSNNATLSVTERSWIRGNSVQPLGVATLRSGQHKSVVIDAVGIASVVFTQEHADGSTHIWAARTTPNAASTGNYVDLTPNLAAGVVASKPKLAMNASGQKVATWQEFDPVTQRSRVVWAETAGTSAWSVTGGSDIGGSSPDYDAFDPDVVDNNGASFELVFRLRHASSATTSTFLMAARIVVGTPTPGYNTVANLQLEMGAPRLVSDRAGNVLVAWTYLNDDGQGGQSVWTNHLVRNSAGVSFWLLANAAPAEAVQGEVFELTDVAMNGNGDAVVMWGDSVGRIYARQFRFAQGVPGWLGAEHYAANGTGGTGAAVDITDSGAITIVGTGGTPSGSIMATWRYTMGAWSAPAPQTLLTLSSGSVAAKPRIGHDAAGNVILAWNQWTQSETSSVHAQRFHAGLNQWRALADVAPAYANGADLAVSPSGRAALYYETQVTTGTPVFKLGVSTFR
jgi:hypothetical protein